MRRRSFIISGVCAGTMVLPQMRERSLAQTAGFDFGMEALNRQVLAAFPFELVTVPGEQAFATWEELASAGRGIPVVLGSTEDVVRIADLLLPSSGFQARSAEEILAAAGNLRHPDDYLEYIAREAAVADELLRELLQDPNAELPTMIVVGEDGNRTQLSDEEVREQMLLAGADPPLGEWPAQTGVSPGLTVPYEVVSGAPYPEAHIALVPAQDATEIPAYLNWGGWNANPPPEYHVAALRSWRERFGAELIGLSGDVMNVRVTRPPLSREMATELAWEQYRFCNDIVTQGVGTIHGLAGALLGADWWYLWWD